MALCAKCSGRKNLYDKNMAPFGVRVDNPSRIGRQGSFVDSLQSPPFEVEVRPFRQRKGRILIPAKFLSRGVQVLFGDARQGEMQYQASALKPAPLSLVHGIGAGSRDEKHAYLWPAPRTADRNQVDAKGGLD